LFRIKEFETFVRVIGKFEFIPVGVLISIRKAFSDLGPDDSQPVRKRGANLEPRITHSRRLLLQQLNQGIKMPIPLVEINVR
jgi:hypothetical protein